MSVTPRPIENQLEDTYLLENRGLCSKICFAASPKDVREKFINVVDHHPGKI